jgi:DNA-binding GntR family transcriptional regulator
MSPTTSPEKTQAELAQAPLGSTMTTITTAVANRLREEIHSGALPPGTRLRQAHVAENFGVSTTPVREAFAALEREGLLQSNAHRGVIVFEPSISDLREIYEIRTPLEALATELGAANLTDDDLKLMKKLHKDMIAANRKKDWATAGECNDAFHYTIYKRADRERLLKLITDLRSASGAYIGLFPKLPGRMKEVEREHKEIYEFCAARQPKKAAKAMVAHLTYTGNAIQQHIEEEE